MRYITAGESHGRVLTAIVSGVPAGIPIDAADIDADLARRQVGYGRGGRQAIETDRVLILSGVRFGVTIGSPVALSISNRDWDNWLDVMATSGEKPEGVRVTAPRPGHADLAGVQKIASDDVRDILERASARETAARVAVGGIAKCLLRPFGIAVRGWVAEIGDVVANHAGLDPEAIFAAAEVSEVRVADADAERRIIAAIDDCKKRGDTLGGIVEVVTTGLPPGLGSHVHWDRKLDGRLAHALMSIQAVKGVEIGLGFETARRPGSAVHDEIYFDEGKREFRRRTNMAGGTEGGMTSGAPLVVRVAFKPLATLMKPLHSVDIGTKAEAKGAIERSDVCAIPAAAVIAEAVVAFVIAEAFLEKFGGDSLKEISRNYQGYLQQISQF